jgi:hypothetical protein
MLVTTDGSLCSGTLIGCQTFLTAAHCICTIPGVTALDGAQCNASPAQLDPTRFLVFFQHAGSFRVAGVAVHPGYIPDTASDLALLRLASPVEGIAPTAINTVAKPAFGTMATIAGFGATQAWLRSSAAASRRARRSIPTCSGIAIESRRPPAPISRTPPAAACPRPEAGGPRSSASTVTDTQTGNVKTYSNPDLTAAPPVEDTSALPCG